MGIWAVGLVCKQLCCRGVPGNKGTSCRVGDRVLHFLVEGKGWCVLIPNTFFDYWKNGEWPHWECGHMGPRASSLMSQVVISLLMMTCYPGKKPEHRLQCHFVFPPCFSQQVSILLGRRFNSHLMFLLECFLVELHVYTWMFGSQIQLTSVGPSLSQAAQGVCWICQAWLGGWFLDALALGWVFAELVSLTSFGEESTFRDKYE